MLDASIYTLLGSVTEKVLSCLSVRLFKFSLLWKQVEDSHWGFHGEQMLHVKEWKMCFIAVWVLNIPEVLLSVSL